MSELVTVVKIGGNIIDDPKRLESFLSDFSKISGSKILVHGGGKTANTMLEKLGHKVKMIDGRRVTDQKTLEVITSVYAGKINKSIVAALNGFGIKVLGLTGADGDLIRAKKRSGWKHDYGFVGDVENVDGDLISTLLSTGNSLVIAPITHDGQGQLLNTNADTIACEIAKETAKAGEVRLIYCFELPGVMGDIEDPSSKIGEITIQAYEKMKADNLISKGMLPKLDNCFDAVKSGVREVVIGQAENLIDLASLKNDQNFGTRILP